MKIKIQSPIILIPDWKDRMIEFAKQGKSMGAIKEIRDGLNVTFESAVFIWNNVYKEKYFKFK